MLGAPFDARKLSFASPAVSVGLYYSFYRRVGAELSYSLQLQLSSSEFLWYLTADYNNCRCICCPCHARRNGPHSSGQDRWYLAQAGVGELNLRFKTQVEYLPRGGSFMSRHQYQDSKLIQLFLCCVIKLRQPPNTRARIDYQCIKKKEKLINNALVPIKLFEWN